ncbi:MAG: formate dehydrogenase accessory sulfurtransferase FdhD [Pseudomonadota bacterium]
MDAPASHQHAPSSLRPLLRVGEEDPHAAYRTLINEVPVALVFNGTTLAVMMASPLQIDDFAIGFALSEGYIQRRSDIEELDIVPHPTGIEARFWVVEACAEALRDRRRATLGPIGCGLCGIESLDQAIRDVPPVTSSQRISVADLERAFGDLRKHQRLHDETRSCHAAGFFHAEHGLAFCREDVGRQNALDKIIGAVATSGLDPESGAILMTSRLSVELIQKAATVGFPLLAGVSGPSALAVELAQEAGMTLLGFCKGRSFDVFSGPERVTLDR